MRRLHITKQLVQVELEVGIKSRQVYDFQITRKMLLDQALGVCEQIALEVNLADEYISSIREDRVLGLYADSICGDRIFRHFQETY